MPITPQDAGLYGSIELEAVLRLQTEKAQDRWRKYVNIGSAIKRSEMRAKQVSGLTPLVRRNPGGAIATDQRQIVAEKTFYPWLYGKAVEVTREASEWDKYSFASSSEQKMALAKAVEVTINRTIVNFLDNAFVTTFSEYCVPSRVGDEALIELTHTTAFGTASNRAAGNPVLSYGAFMDLYQQALQQKDDVGNEDMPSGGVTLIVPPALYERAKSIAGSDKAPGGMNNDINVARSAGLIKDILVLPELASSTAWFLQFDGHKLTYRPNLDVRTEEDWDSNRQVMRYNTTMAFFAAALDWRNMYGSSGA